MTRRHAVLLGVAGVLLAGLAACGKPAASEGRAPQTAHSSEAAADLGVQPRQSIAPGSDTRAGASLLTNLSGSGLAEKTTTAEWMDDVVSGVCGNKRGGGVFSSKYGQYKEWTGAGVRVQQFAGVFGAVTAAAAVEQVKSKLSCTEYTADADPGRGIPNQDPDGVHRITARPTVPSLPGVENSVMFCEVHNESTNVCQAAIARKDVVSRVTVSAASAENADRLTREILALAAAKLNEANP